MKKTLATLVAATAVAATVATALVPAPARAATTTITPEALPRGAEVVGPHLASPGSTTLVDGDVRVAVSARWIDVLGASGGTYVVLVERSGTFSVLRVGPGGGERAVVRDVDPYSVGLSSDGRLLSVVRSQSASRTTIEVLRVRDGRRHAQRSFVGSLSVLDVRGDRAVVGGPDSGAIDWDLASGTVTRVTRRWAYEADIAADRLATFDRDPYAGGCTVVTSLSAPTTALFRGCRERVEAFAPDGRRFASIDKLSDGAGPSRVLVRSTRGSLLGDYTVRGFFGHVRFESARALLLQTFGQRRAVEVRCVATTCARASAASRTSSDRYRAAYPVVDRGRA